jgi:hypothetical protein
MAAVPRPAGPPLMSSLRSINWRASSSRSGISRAGSAWMRGGVTGFGAAWRWCANRSQFLHRANPHSQPVRRPGSAPHRLAAAP